MMVLAPFKVNILCLGQYGCYCYMPILSGMLLLFDWHMANDFMTILIDVPLYASAAVPLTYNTSYIKDINKQITKIIF